MSKRIDLHEGGAIALAIAIALGVLTWQVLPQVIPSLAEEEETAAAPPETAEPAKPRPADDAALPVNPNLVRGQLDNGLAYFVLPHKKPEDRAHLWLVVKAGAVQEDDDQRGLAHFIEHMAFNGTEKYEKQAIIDYLEGIGMRFGPEINAETGFDRTVYKLKVPTDDPAAIAKGLDFLHEWATAIKFDDKEIEAERGVVLGEWRARRGAEMRMAEKLLPAALAGSRYPDRLPIGTPESLETAKRDQLVRYYKDWYRPSLMAVIAVGDFDKAAVETQIKEVFGDLKDPESPRPRPVTPVPGHDETRAAVITDDEAKQPNVLILDKIPHEPVKTYGDARRDLRGLVAILAITQRLSELGQAPDAPFSMAAVAPDPSKMVEAVDLLIAAAMAKNESVQGSLETLLMELTRAERHGFKDTEVERIRKQLAAMLNMAANAYDYQDGEELMPDLIDAFSRGSTFVGPDLYRELVSELDHIDAENTLAELVRTSSNSSRVILLMGPSSIAMPTEAQVQEMAARIAAADIAPWGKGDEAKPLMSEIPSKGSITNEQKLPELDAVEWKLSNGATVVVKKTDFKDDEVLLTATAAGGKSLIADADLTTAHYVSAIAQESGLGNLDNIELRDATAGKMAAVSPVVRGDSVALNGSARPEDLETLFQLLHLRMNRPRNDAEAFTRWRTRELQEIDNRNKLPQTQAMHRFTRKLWMDHPRSRPVTRKMLEGVTHERALEIYEQLFSDAADFTFVFVGDIDIDAMRPLVETYIASLPGTSTRETPKDSGERVVPGLNKMRERAGREPRSTSVTIFHGAKKWSLPDSIDQGLVSEVLKLRLREVLREDEGGTYGVGISPSWSADTLELHDITASFIAEPKRVAELHRIMLAEIDKVRKGTDIKDDAFEKIRETWKREHEEALKKNAFWQRIIARSYRRGSDPTAWLDIESKLARVTRENLIKVAPVYLPAKNRFDFFLDPDPAALKKAQAEKKAKGN